MITCGVCGMVYVGETNRTIRSRIKEHTNNMSSLVFLHMSNHDDSLEFKWTIIDRVPDTSERKTMETIVINDLRNKYSLINGYLGKKPILEL